MAEISSIDQFDLPKSILLKLVKEVLPDSQIQKDAKTAMTKSCTVFINYLISTAFEITKAQKQRNLTTKHVLDAIKLIEFNEFLPEIERQFKEYKDFLENKKKQKLADQEMRETKEGDDEEQEEEEDVNADEEDEQNESDNDNLQEDFNQEEEKDGKRLKIDEN